MDAMRDVKMRTEIGESYRLTWNEGWDWAVVTLTPSGLMTCHSSYGLFGHKWNAFGDDFKAFLIGLNADYLLGKISSHNYFDGYVYKEHCLQTILAGRKQQSLTKEAARDLWNYYQDDFEPCDHAESAVAQLSSSEVFETHDVDVWHSEFTPKESYSPNEKAFAYEIFPQFATLLKEQSTEGVVA